jgi:glycosyltransferase involved in cell wall biosynthesis
MLEVALRSALGQSEVAVEVVVSDQASSDGTREMLAHFEDPRVRVIRSEVPLRPAAARNHGLAVVTTPWVSFLDDDDIWAVDRLRAQLDALELSGGDWCTTGEVQFNDRDHRICGSKRPPDPLVVWPGMLAANLVPGGGSGVLARTDLVRRVGGFREDIPRSEDWELWIRLARAAPLAVVDRPLVAYRLSEGSRAHRHPAAVHAALQEWMDREYGELRREYGLLEDRAEALRYEAASAARAGRRWQAARAYLATAVRYRRPAQVLLGCASAVAPKLTTAARDHRTRSRMDPRWLAEGLDLLAQAYPDDPRRRPTVAIDETIG